MKQQLCFKGNERMVYPMPNASDHRPRTQSQVSSNDMLFHERGYMNFQSHRTKESDKSIHLQITQVETLGKQDYSNMGKSLLQASCSILQHSQLQGWCKLKLCQVQLYILRILFSNHKDVKPDTKDDSKWLLKRIDYTPS